MDALVVQLYYHLVLQFQLQRKQLSIIPESRINSQAAAAYENFRSKSKLITKGSQLKEIREIGKKIEFAVSAFFERSRKNDPTKNFGWDYVLC